MTPSEALDGIQREVPAPPDGIPSGVLAQGVIQSGVLARGVIQCEGLARGVTRSAVLARGAIQSGAQFSTLRAIPHSARFWA